MFLLLPFSCLDHILSMSSRRNGFACESPKICVYDAHHGAIPSLDTAALVSAAAITPKTLALKAAAS